MRSMSVDISLTSSGGSWASSGAKRVPTRSSSRDAATDSCLEDGEPEIRRKVEPGVLEGVG